MKVHFNQVIPKGSHYQGSMSADMAQGGLIVENLWFAWIDDQCVGDFCLEFKKEKSMSIHSFVAEPWRRQGIATLFYNEWEKKYKREGWTLVPGEYQTENAKSFWKQRQAQKTEASIHETSFVDVKEQGAGVLKKIKDRQENKTQGVNSNSKSVGFK